MRSLTRWQTRAVIGVVCSGILAGCGGGDDTVQPYATPGKGGESGAAGATAGGSAGSAGSSVAGASGSGTAGSAGNGTAGTAGSGGAAGTESSGGAAGSGMAGAGAGGSGTAGSGTAGAGGSGTAGTGGSGTAGTGGSGTAGAGGSGLCGSASQTFCDGSCVDLQSDTKNCGSCGFLCSAGSTCAQGSCVISCGKDLTACGDLCVDVASSTRNCGSCGKECDTDQVCNGGVCSSTCASGKDKCSGECVDLKADKANCGTCGNACGPSDSCVDGTCQLTCTGTAKKCGTTCVDVASDVSNCGACGNACGGGEVCDNGSCKLTCDLPNRICGGLCIDPSSNKANCGSCGNACQGAETCVAGECRIVCEAGESICGGACVDKGSDAQNCGSCGNACNLGESCVSGSCKVVCPDALVACGATCFDLKSDKDHCGSCATACSGSQVCADGACKNTCSGTQTSCSGSCVELSTDVSNCGSCGNKCATGATCNGTCACPGAQEVCSGACVDTKSDTKNCGGCGTTCGAEETCSAGACVPTCESQLKGNPLKDRWNFVWDGLERTSATFAEAEAQCGGIGGRLPMATEIHRASAARTSDVGQSTHSNLLWTNVPYTPTVQMTARLNDGVTSTSAISSKLTYRCVCAPPATDGYSGHDCIGSSKAECLEFKREGKTYLMDTVDRATMPAGPAAWECSFVGGQLPPTDVYADLLTRNSGIGKGNSAWHHTSDQGHYNGDIVIRWGDVGTWTPNDAGMSYGVYSSSYSARCMGVKGAIPAKSPSAPGNALTIPTTGFSIENNDRPATTFQGALDICWNLGGHLPITAQLYDGLVAGMGNGTNQWLWTGDETEYNGTQFTVGLLSFSGTAPRYQYVYSGGIGAITHSYKHDATLRAYRCSYPAIDVSYKGPTADQCNIQPCAEFRAKPGDTTAAMWIDKFDRGTATWPAAASACTAAGGRLASERDLAEAIRQGLTGGTGSLIWTADTSAYESAPYVRAHVVKWSGTTPAFDDTYSTYMTWDYPSNSHPYRCAFTNEYR